MLAAKPLSDLCVLCGKNLFQLIKMESVPTNYILFPILVDFSLFLCNNFASDLKQKGIMKKQGCYLNQEALKMAVDNAVISMNPGWSETAIKLTIPPPGIIIISKPKPGGNHMIKKKLLTAMIFVALITLNLNGWFVLNDTEGAFNPNTCKDCKSYTLVALEQLIATAAGYFIQSNSDYQLFLKTIEISDVYGMNNEDMVNSIDNAIKNMELANETYYQILQVSSLMEYNPSVLGKLKNFYYDNYQYINGLNPAIFQQVKRLLKPGNVRGCYQRFYIATNKILVRLRSIKTSADTLTIPRIPDCWRLNQLYLEMGLFGQYAAEVFMNIE